MKVLVVTDAYWPDHTGGISKCLLNEVEPLVRAGHECVVLTRAQVPGSPRREQRDGYEVFRHPSPRAGSRLYYLHPFVTMATVGRHVARLHRERRFDVIYVHHTFHAAALGRLRPRPPVVWCFHAPAAREIALDAGRRKYGLATRGVRRLGRWLGRIELSALEAADHVLTRSEFMAGEARRLYPSVDWTKSSVLPLGVDTQRFAFVEKPRLAREDAAAREELRLLTVRRLVARMGLDQLIAAMPGLLRTDPTASLDIAGRGYLRESLAAQARQLCVEHAVRFLGFVPEDDLPGLYGGADIFVLPTADLEGFGLATIEALSCGTPVLATPVGANAEVVGPLGPEYVAGGTDDAALLGGIRRVAPLAAEGHARRACREYCCAHFDRDAVARRLAELLGGAQ